MSSQYGELQLTSGWDRFLSLGHPANFNGFRVFASLLQRRRSTEANQTFHNVWPLPGLVDYISAYISGGCCSVAEVCQVQSSLCVFQVLRSPIRSVTARQASSGREPNFAALSTGHHLYSAGRPSGWALAHILVVLYCIVWYTLRIVSLHCESKKGCHPIHGYNFVNSWSICKILSLLQRPVNFQRIPY